MSQKHPIIAVTGSSGASRSSVKMAFEHMFYRENIVPCIIEGDSFHRYDRYEIKEAVSQAQANDEHVSHFGPAANHLA